MEEFLMLICSKGRSLHQSGDFVEAKKNYDQAINFNNKSADAYLFRGALKVAVGQKNRLVMI